MRLCRSDLFFSIMVLIFSAIGAHDSFDGQELISEKRSSPKGTSYHLKGFHRNLPRLETERFLYELYFRSDAVEPTEDDLDCLREGIKENMADIATDYLVQELNYPRDTIWGEVEEIEYREARAKLEQKKEKIEQELEAIEKKQLRAQKKLDRIALKFEEEEKGEQEEIAKIKIELQKERTGLNPLNEDESVIKKQLEEKLLESEKKREEREKKFQKKAGKLLVKLPEKEQLKREKLDEVLKQLEDLDSEWKDITSYVNCKNKKDLAARRRCRRRYRRFKLSFAVKTKCSFCWPDDADSSRFLIEEEMSENAQANSAFVIWMEEKMEGKLKNLCTVAMEGMDYISFSYDDTDDKED